MVWLIGCTEATKVRGKGWRGINRGHYLEKTWTQRGGGWHTSRNWGKYLRSTRAHRALQWGASRNWGAHMGGSRMYRGTGWYCCTGIPTVRGWNWETTGTHRGGGWHTSRDWGQYLWSTHMGLKVGWWAQLLSFWEKGSFFPSWLRILGDHVVPVVCQSLNVFLRDPWSSPQNMHLIWKYWNKTGLIPEMFG